MIVREKEPVKFLSHIYHYHTVLHFWITAALYHLCHSHFDCCYFHTDTDYHCSQLYLCYWVYCREILTIVFTSTPYCTWLFASCTFTWCAADLLHDIWACEKWDSLIFIKIVSYYPQPSRIPEKQGSCEKNSKMRWKYHIIM